MCARLALLPRNHQIVLALDVVVELNVATHPLHNEGATFLELSPVAEALGRTEENSRESLSIECSHRRIVAAWLTKCQKLCGVSGHTGARVVTQKQVRRGKQRTVWVHPGCRQIEVVQRICTEKMQTHSNTGIVSFSGYFAFNNAPC